MSNRYLETKVIETDVTEPVTVDEMKEWAAVSTSDYDSLLTTLIKIARKKVESFTHISLVTKTVTFTAYLCDKTILPFPKINSIISVEYYEGQDLDGDSDWETIEPQYYNLIGENVKEFYPPYAGMYRITYTTTAFTDQELLHDVKRVCNWMFRNRGDEPAEMPLSLFENAKQFKIYTWG